MVLLKQLLQDLKAWYPQISSFSLVLVQAGACAAGMPAFRIGDWFFSR